MNREQEVLMSDSKMSDYDDQENDTEVNGRQQDEQEECGRENAIEMLINVIQNELFLSEAKAHKCIRASTANWKGSLRRNIEIDLLQEISNKPIKSINTTCAKNTHKAETYIITCKMF